MVHEPELVEIMPDGERVFSLLSQKRLRLAGSTIDMDLVEFPAHVATPPRVHRRFNEYFHVLGGEGVVVLNGEPQAIRAGHSFAVEPGTTHCFETGDLGLRIIAVCAPFFDPEDNTIVGAP